MALPDVTGALLAGGQGERMGKVRKGLLRFADGTLLIARSLSILRSLFAETVIVSGELAPYLLFGAPIAGDPIPGKGAPGGLLAALTAAKTPWVFLVGCDMPALDPAVITALAEERGKGVQAVVAGSEERPEPLHAFWSVEVAPVLEGMLRAGDPSFRDFLARIPHRLVPMADLEARVPGAARSFADVDAPEDLVAFGLKAPR